MYKLLPITEVTNHNLWLLDQFFFCHVNNVTYTRDLVGSGRGMIFYTRMNFLLKRRYIFGIKKYRALTFVTSVKKFHFNNCFLHLIGTKESDEEIK